MAKRPFNIEIAHTYTKGSSSKVLLDTVSLFAAPSLSGGGENKFLSMFIHVRNARKTETPECFTAVYQTIETLGRNPGRLVSSLPAVTLDEKLDLNRFATEVNMVQI